VPDDSSSQALSEALRSSFFIIKIIMFGLMIAFLSSGVRIVGPQEKAIILRFGKPIGQGEKALLGPGLHWTFPAPIDEMVRIPVNQVQTVRSTVGWYQTTAAQEAAKNELPPGESLNPAADGYVLTGDGNIIHVRGTVRYRIAEPGLKYMFHFTDATNLVSDAFNHAIVRAAASFKVDDILTHNFTGFREEVRRALDDLVLKQDLGVVVDQLDLEVIPPRQLRAQFETVTQTKVRGDKIRDDARSYANQTVSRSQAEAAALVNGAESDRTRLVELVAAEAKRFTDLLPFYRDNPELFVKVHRARALQSIFTNAQDKWMLPQRAGGKQPELRLELSREPVKRETVQPTREH
jgi:membrane protease subunit HflK